MVNWCNVWAEIVELSTLLFGLPARDAEEVVEEDSLVHGPRFRVEWSVRLCRELCGRSFLNVEEVDGLEVQGLSLIHI